MSYTPDPYAGELDKKSIGFKNRNPLNLRPGRDTWHGQKGTMRHPRAGAFVVFETVEDGLRAAAITLINYKRIYGADTLEKIIGIWAPPEDNNHTANYIAAVVRETGIDRDRRLELLEQPEELARIMKAMARVENGMAPPFRDETYAEAVRRARKRFGKV